MLSPVKTFFIIACCILLAIVAFFFLPDDIQKLVITEEKTITCSVDGQLTGVYVTGKTLQFAKDHLHKGDTISLIFRSIAQNYWYDRYHEFPAFQGKSKNAIFVIAE